MQLNEYQQLAARTINKELSETEKSMHALHGMSAETGELHGLYQKCYQGHKAAVDHIQKEVGDLLWFIAEYCSAWGWTLDEIAQMNIDKLRKRYPDGFAAERSINRKEGDV